MDSPPEPNKAKSFQPHPHHSGEHSQNPFNKDRKHTQHEGKYNNRPHFPKMAFPVFEGKDPKIWRDKCEDYFRIFDIPEFLWVSMASMRIVGDAARWVRVEKNRGDLGNWTTFMQKVEDKFGAYDYMCALQDLLELQQQGSVEDYVLSFESLQFQIEMHNTGYDKMFFITQFTRGLKPDISAAVQAQVPNTMERAVLLAKIQQQLQERGKPKYQRTIPSQKYLTASTHKIEPKQESAVSPYSKERHKRDYCKANNLCFIVWSTLIPTIYLNALKGQEIKLMP
jgi:hypothetical protein